MPLTYSDLLEAVVRMLRQDLAAAQRSGSQVWLEYAQRRLREAEALAAAEATR